MTTDAAPFGGDARDARSLVRLRIFDTPSRELLHALKPPWPRSLQRLYELEEQSTHAIDVRKGVVTVGAAVSALREVLASRLGVLAFVASGLEELGWEVRLEEDGLLATTQLTPAEARDQLEDHGIAGPMCMVADLDDSGWPWIRDAAHAERT